jgi:hypothetical protein
MQENDAKRNRAIKKALDERKTRDSKEIEIQGLKEQQNKLSSKKEKGSNAVDKSIFQTILLIEKMILIL